MSVSIPRISDAVAALTAEEIHESSDSDDAQKGARHSNDNNTGVHDQSTRFSLRIASCLRQDHERCSVYEDCLRFSEGERERVSVCAWSCLVWSDELSVLRFQFVKLQGQCKEHAKFWRDKISVLCFLLIKLQLKQCWERTKVKSPQVVAPKVSPLLLLPEF